MTANYGYLESELIATVCGMTCVYAASERLLTLKSKGWNLPSVFTLSLSLLHIRSQCFIFCLDLWYGFEICTRYLLYITVE